MIHLPALTGLVLSVCLLSLHAYDQVIGMAAVTALVECILVAEHIRSRLPKN